jgi:signal transduction histidine kinase
MLQHSRHTSGVEEPTDINALCDEYFRLSYHGLRAKDKNFNTEMKTDFDNSIGEINIVPQDIGRVLLNLFNNAFYAIGEGVRWKAKGTNRSLLSLRSVIPPSPPRGEPVPTHREGRGEVEIRVSDNGNGIPQNIVDKFSSHSSPQNLQGKEQDWV